MCRNGALCPAFRPWKPPCDQSRDFQLCPCWNLTTENLHAGLDLLSRDVVSQLLLSIPSAPPVKAGRGPALGPESPPVCLWPGRDPVHAAGDRRPTQSLRRSARLLLRASSRATSGLSSFPAWKDHLISEGLQSHQAGPHAGPSTTLPCSREPFLGLCWMLERGTRS